jgi:hypothetical protein
MTHNPWPWLLKASNSKSWGFLHGLVIPKSLLQSMISLQSSICFQLGDGIRAQVLAGVKV